MNERFCTSRVLAMACSLTLTWAATASAQKVTTEFDDTVDFGKFKTFAVRDGQMNSAAPALNSDLTKKRITTAIERGLTARGLTKADGPSDLNVFFTLGSSGVLKSEVVPAGRRGGARVVRLPGTEGTLVIGLRDPATRSLVWRGIASEDKAEPVDILKKLDDMVRKIVDKYPPKK
jgi:uncharacterized protein DUF4136